MAMPMDHETGNDCATLYSDLLELTGNAPGLRY